MEEEYEVDHDEALRVAEAMHIYGGGFVQSLADAIERADRENLLKIKQAFREYWDKYLEMSEKEDRGD